MSKLSYLGELNESRENAGGSREARFAYPNRRACSQAIPLHIQKTDVVLNVDCEQSLDDRADHVDKFISQGYFEN